MDINKEKLLQIWNDKVWSTIISTIIIGILTTIWMKINSLSLSEMYDGFISILVFEVPIYTFLALFGFIYIIRWVISFFRYKKPIYWRKKIGNYRFGELYEILQNQNFPLGTVGMSYAGMQPPEEDLLSLFYTNSMIFSKGIHFEDNLGDGGYVFSILAPKLASFDLVEKKGPKDGDPEYYVSYQITETGKKFLACIEKLLQSKNKTRIIKRDKETKKLKLHDPPKSSKENR